MKVLVEELILGEGFTAIVGSPTTKVIRSIDNCNLGRPRSAQNSNRQQNYRANKFKHSFNRDTQESKWQQDEPHDRVYNQSQQRKRPAQYK
jgi:hypothetical protein